MGLDAVEMVMRYEETFGIDIPDKDVEKILTPSEMIEYLARRLAAPASSTECLQQRTFYLLRKKSNEVLGFPRKEFRPDTPLKLLGSQENARWDELRHAVGARHWPEFPKRPILRALKKALDPSGPEIVRDLVAFLVSREPSLIGATENWTRERIRCAIREVTLEYVRSADYREDARYVRDMHLG